MVIVAVGGAPGAEGAPSEKDPNAGLYRVLLRHVVSSECQAILCLVAIERQPASEELMKILEPLGRVSVPTAEDFIWEDGAVKGFSQRHGRIVDVRRIVKQANSTATVEVAFLTTGLGSSTCKYRLQRVSGEWVVDSDETTCTL
jgi:hypothetical protein